MDANYSRKRKWARTDECDSVYGRKKQGVKSEERVVVLHSSNSSLKAGIHWYAVAIAARASAVTDVGRRLHFVSATSYHLQQSVTRTDHLWTPPTQFDS